MDLEVGEIRGERDEDVRASSRDDPDELGDDMMIDGVGREKSLESGRHKTKDRSKTKDHGSRGRERTKETENEEHVAKDRDRSESSREKRKVERSEYGKDKEHDKEWDREGRSRDRLHEEEYDRDKYRDKERGKERDRDMERSTDREYDKSRDHGKSRGKERDNATERERDLVREHDREKERNRDRIKVRDNEKDVQRELERDRRKEKEHERGKDRNREKEKTRDRTKDREKERTKDREKEKDRERDKERDKVKEKYREKENERNVETDRDRSRARDREKGTSGSKETEKDERIQSDLEDARKQEVYRNDKDSHEVSGSKYHQNEKPTESSSSLGLEDRITRMREERMRKKSDDGASEILTWVTKSRKIEEKKNAEKEALRLSKVFEEQDKILDDSDDEEADGHAQKDLAGVKILHGLDKVIEGGAVVLTLKDQDILKGGDVNDEIDMLENVEIGEQKQRDEAYRAAKKKTGLYTDKFNDEPGSRKILPQYDDPEDEGVSLDESGRFTGEAEKRLEELRKRIEGNSTQKSFQDLTSSMKISSDYYTTEEMLQFKKPKKKKSLRKKDKLDLDVLEAEAISSGLGASDLGSRKDMKRQAAKEEKDKMEAEMRSKAYQTAYEKAEEASKVLRQEQTLTFNSTEDENLVFGEDYEDLQRSLEQTRKLALRKQDEAAPSGPQTVALLATSIKEQENSQSQSTGDPQEEKVVITEVEEFVLGLKLNEGIQKPESEDVFMDEDEAPASLEPEAKADVDGWTDVEESSKSENPVDEEKDDASPDEIIHEVAVGKGLSGALKLLKERGALKETIDWGGRTMDKKKSKLVGLNDNEGAKEIRIERTDEFGRIMTPKEAFRMLSHKFHGKGPGKMKQEKRMKQYQEDLKTKQMKASDTPLLAVEKMREAQAQLKTPYLVLSGHVKPGQTSDPRSGFATVEKDHLGSLTPMLGDKKVEHFLGIKRKPEASSMGPPPSRKPKP